LRPGHNAEAPLKPSTARAEYWALAMTELPSVSGSAEEAAFREKLAALLRTTPTFPDRPQDLWTILVPGGRHRRACLAALARGRGRRTAWF
jgi:arginine utilization protein RocB